MKFIVLTLIAVQMLDWKKISIRLHVMNLRLVSIITLVLILIMFAGDYNSGCNNVDEDSVGLQECAGAETPQELLCDFGETCGIICDKAGNTDCGRCYAFCYGDCYCATGECGIKGVEKVECVW